MNILIAHHLEPLWEEALQRFGTSLEVQCEKVAEWLAENIIDCVIITQFEQDREAQRHEAYYPLYQILEDKGIKLTWHEYGYGWERDCFLDSAIEGVDYAQGGNHSEVVMLEAWMRELKSNKIYLCGAFDGECIEDMEIALEACSVSFERVEHLIV
jgi:hypothetical protein